jgi:hypothetical protein
MNHPEHNEQTALFQWAAMQSRAYPELEFMHSIPNAIRCSPRLGKWLKDEGKKSGVWDIFLPAPRGAYSGMYIEMKIGNNKLTPEQERFQKYLDNWYRFAVCYSWIDAKIAIIHYLEDTKF